MPNPPHTARLALTKTRALRGNGKLKPAAPLTPTFSTSRFFAANAHARSPGSHLWLRLGTALFAVSVAATCATNQALGDEDGVSFWIPGFFGSLAAVPQQPGWSISTTYYHTEVSASGDVAREGVRDRQNPQ